MSSCNRRTTCRTVLWGLFWLLILGRPSAACGPFFPNRMLPGGDSALLEAPVTSFAGEIARMHIPLPARLRAVPGSGDFKGDTIAADLKDLEEALQLRGAAPDETKAILAAYTAARRALRDYSDRMDDWRWEVFNDPKTPRPRLQGFEIPRDIPEEFRLYLLGSSFHYQDSDEQALRAWWDVLRLPPAERRFRSTWAAYMIGRRTLDYAPEHARVWFLYCRKLAVKGYRDSLGLAAAGLGWEARAELDLWHLPRAIELYAAQYATGDLSAVASLQTVVELMLEMSRADLAEYARSDTTRRIITAYVVSEGGPFRSGPPEELTRKWLAAIERAGIVAVEEAGRLACAAYQIGDMETAPRWVARARQDDILAQWIRAKLLLRKGDVERATKLLAGLVSRFPGFPGFGDGGGELRVAWHINNDNPSLVGRVRGELGVLQLSRGQYAEALDALLRGGYWADAAHVAERVLTAAELIAYVERAWPAGRGRSPGEGEHRTFMPPTEARTNIRYLLARRLARTGRWREARPYYPEAWRPRLDAYIGAIRAGHDRSHSSKQRAAAFWRAACIARYEGMELLGTEIEPDWSMLGGWYERQAILDVRDDPEFATLAPATPDEQRRGRLHTADPRKRFHYRYTAADHAWRAAALMPDQSDETARVLCIAGTWLKNRDPEAADRFYKALVRRCGKTGLGHRADLRHWFPEIEIDYDALPR